MKLSVKHLYGSCACRYLLNICMRVVCVVFLLNLCMRVVCVVVFQTFAWELCVSLSVKHLYESCVCRYLLNICMSVVYVVIC